MKKYILLILVLILTYSCSNLTGEEIARLKLDKVSTEDNIIEKTISLDLKTNDELLFWSQMDFEHEGDIEIRYRVRVYLDENEYKILEYDPREKNITFGELKSTFNNKTKWSFSGKNGELKIDQDGRYTFKAILKTSINNSFKINKSDLIIKK